MAFTHAVLQDKTTVYWSSEYKQRYGFSFSRKLTATTEAE